MESTTPNAARLPTGGMILSPAEKQLAAPLLKFLQPEFTNGRKELVINRPGEVAFESYDGTWQFYEAPELDLDALMRIMNLIAERTNQTYSMANPILSAKLPGGHRAQFVAGQQNAQKFSLAVRLTNEREFSLDAFVMSPEQKEKITAAAAGKRTILISGGTGSGKTTFMNALLKYIPAEERLVTIEDVPELRVPHRNLCQFIFANFSKTDANAAASADGGRQMAVNNLLNACLRMRPDRILLGEIRKENAFTFCSAINTGHAGSMATVHANSPKAALDAVINRVMLNGDVSETAINVLRRQLEEDLFGVVQLERKGTEVHAYFEELNKAAHA